MKKHGILNSHIAKVLSDLGHTDEIVIADCGLPIPDGVAKIDLALTLGTPTFLEVLDAVLADMEVESFTLASEIRIENENVLNELEGRIGEKQIEWVSHESFKEQTKQAKVIIRTGEITPYANIILKAGVIF
ncbi:MAG: D-ribose pyranase [Turicibacter sp.]|nr:D-ribose pyranase [Turicibacter sp.]